MSTQAVLLDVEGEFPVNPEIRVQPTAQRAAPTANVGWKYRRRYTIANTGSEPISRYPFLIDLGDTTPLTTTKAQADGDDLRVWLNGQEVARTLKAWDTASSGVWVIIPYLGAGESILYEVVYGNASAVSPPTLDAFEDGPAFDYATSTNTSWAYLVNRVAANAGKGGWTLDDGDAQPNVNQGAPGAWQAVNTLASDDDRRQERYSTYVDTNTYYQGRFQAKRAKKGGLLVGQDNGADGVMIRNPIGIASVTADIRWINLAIGDTGDAATTPVGRVVILTRNAPNEQWKVLYENAALQATEATIASATRTPAAAVKELAFAVWPYEGNNVDQAARPDRYIEAGWYSTLSVALQAGVLTQTTTQSEVEVYELATELRHGGGGDATAVPPYKSVYLGNAKSESGVGTRRLAVELNQQVVVDTDLRTVEVWNSGLTAKVEDVPIPAVLAVDGVLAFDGTTQEQPSTDWMPLLPTVNPLTNPSADADANNWTRGTVSANVTAGAITRDATTFDSTPAGFSVNITANTAGSGAVVENIANDYLPVGTRENVSVGVAIRTADVDLQPTPTVWFYDAAQALIGSRHVQADWTIPGTAAFYRRLYAVDVPDGAVYYRVGVTIKDKVGAQTGITRWDTVAVNDTEIALLDVAKGTLILTAKWTPRYAYA